MIQTYSKEWVEALIAENEMLKERNRGLKAAFKLDRSNIEIAKKLRAVYEAALPMNIGFISDEEMKALQEAIAAMDNNSDQQSSDHTQP